MKKILIFIILSVFSLIVSGQNQKEISKILEEGKVLYRSEMASWYGTDIFLQDHPSLKEKIGGYFSYMDGNTPKCIFYSSEEKPQVLGTISFDTTFNLNKTVADNLQRDFTQYEKDLFDIREKATTEINRDTTFKSYSNTDFNIIPVIDERKSKKVFILTGPKDEGVVLFGNDYLLTFDKKNNFISTKQLHKSLIVADLSKRKENGGEQKSGAHSHILSEYITSTDICTLLLYEKFTTWDHYIVVSSKYVSVWDCRTNKLLVLTNEAWKKIIERDEKNKGQ